MSAKMGRPKVENPIGIKLSIRLDAEMEKKLNAYCQKHKISKGEAIRKGLHLLLDEEK